MFKWNNRRIDGRLIVRHWISLNLIKQVHSTFCRLLKSENQAQNVSITRGRGIMLRTSPKLFGSDVEKFKVFFDRLIRVELKDKQSQCCIECPRSKLIFSDVLEITLKSLEIKKNWAQFFLYFHHKKMKFRQFLVQLKNRVAVPKTFFLFDFL